jgi:N,N'-diacetyllegionaminate synthase
MTQTFVIAEIGVNHNGDKALALELIERAAEAGADAAKFQSFKAETLVAKGTATVAYQKSRDGSDDQFEMLKRLEMSEELHIAAAGHCKAFGIEFMSTAFDKSSLDLLVELGIKRIKIPSGEITNVPYLRDSAARGLPLILSTGMADLAEVRLAVDILKSGTPAASSEIETDQTPLTVLHCTSAYPTQFVDVNLRAMQSIAAELGVPVGYSDHSVGVTVPPLAVAAGAVVIEKHFTRDRSLPGPDHAASIEPTELIEMVKQIRQVELILGSHVKRPTDAEMEARLLVRRGLKIAKDLEAGSILSEGDIFIRRPATGLAPDRLEWAVGKTLLRSLHAGEALNEEDLH